MPCVWKALPIALDNLLVTKLIPLPLRKGKEDNISTRPIGMLIAWMCQWLLSHTRKKKCMRIEDISINRSVGKNQIFNK